MRQGKYPFVIGFLAVPVTLYSVFVVSPYLQAFWLSMTEWRGIGAPRWIGFANFERLFSDEVFWKAVRHHGVLLLALPLITIAIALFFAFMLNVGGGSRGGQRVGVRGSGFYRVVFFFPQVLAVAIIAVLFQMVYRPDESGLINGVLMKLGLDPIFFLINPNLALWSIIAVLVWQAVGFYVVLFSAGMASIPAEIYEAAELDGASRITMFFRVTIPLLWDTLQVAWVYLGIAAFRRLRHRRGPLGGQRRAGRGHHRAGDGDLPQRLRLQQVRLRLGDGRRALLPDHHVRGADAPGVQAGKRRVLTWDRR